jgi:hypothetical protein
MVRRFTKRLGKTKLRQRNGSIASLQRRRTAQKGKIMVRR